MRDPPWIIRIDHMIEFLDQIEIYLKDLHREKFVANRLVIDDWLSFV